MRFEGSTDYVATPDLMLAVNASIQLQRPCSSGASRHRQDHAGGQVAGALGLPLIQWHIKSTTKPAGLYEYDAVSRAARLATGDDRVRDIRQLHRQGRAVAGLRCPKPRRWY